jgi:hypothetical protein
MAQTEIRTIGSCTFSSMMAALLVSSCVIFCTEAAELPASQGVADLRNLIGINIGAPTDYNEDRLYADVIRISRNFKRGADANGSVPAPVDSQGWPTSDFSFYVWDGIGQMHGTYTVSFKGKAIVSRNPGGAIPLLYDSGSNTSTGSFHYESPSRGFLTLTFTATRRTNSSSPGCGVTSIKLMRPQMPGASKSYPPMTLFANPIKELISKFSVVRFMDFLSTNANNQSRWADRPLPSWPSFNRTLGGINGSQRIGGPWEHVIMLSNETGRDAWINIPAMADDNYVLNVARTFAYGSDGVNPYPAPSPNPVYPPLDKNLKVYVEYSNELWNSAGPFQQFHNNCRLASDELAVTSGRSPLNWDKAWNSVTYNGSAPGRWVWKMCDRHATERSVEISNIFRSVFGDTAMGARIRPVLMSQLGNAGGTLLNEMKMMLDYYDNMAGAMVSDPHPPKYYFYGGGGSGYYSPSTSVATLDAFFADAGMRPEGFAPLLRADEYLVAAMGLKRVAYEGGPDLVASGAARDAISRQAVMDKRMTAAVVNMQKTWSSNGGDLFVYYRATGDYEWGFTNDVFDLSTPKLLAIDALTVAQRSPLTLGTGAPSVVPGSSADTCSRGWKCNPIPDYDYFTADGSRIRWASYTFRSSYTAKWKINLTVSQTDDATVEVYIDGIPIGTRSTSGGPVSIGAGVIDPGIHGVIVRAVSGRFSLDSLAVSITEN